MKWIVPSFPAILGRLSPTGALMIRECEYARRPTRTFFSLIRIFLFLFWFLFWFSSIFHFQHPNSTLSRLWNRTTAPLLNLAAGISINIFVVFFQGTYNYYPLYSWMKFSISLPFRISNIFPQFQSGIPSGVSPFFCLLSWNVGFLRPPCVRFILSTRHANGSLEMPTRCLIICIIFVFPPSCFQIELPMIKKTKIK